MPAISSTIVDPCDALDIAQEVPQIAAHPGLDKSIALGEARRRW